MLHLLLDSAAIAEVQPKMDEVKDSASRIFVQAKTHKELEKQDDNLLLCFLIHLRFPDFQPATIIRCQVPVSACIVISPAKTALLASCFLGHCAGTKRCVLKPNANIVTLKTIH